MADEAKAKGNAAFSAGNFTDAIRHFTEAINLAPTNHVLYSNRSASYASLNQYAEALSDAQKTVEIKPDWSKGYSRLGAAYMGLRRYEDAVTAYRKGLDIDPNNEPLKSGLADAQSSLRSRSAPSSSPFGEAFGPEMWAKLTADPATRAYLNQPDFVVMMKEIQKNPNNLNMYLKDQRVMQALGTLLNVKIATPDSAGDFDMPDSPPPAAEKKAPEQPKAREPEPEPEPMDIPDEEKEVRQRKAEAQKEKEAGNAAYKKKDFETAIQHYTKATELDDEDISFLTNRAAVYLEMGKYDECIKDCDKAVERGRELRADYKMIARALTRKGTALVKLAKTSKDYDAPIETFQKALTEHRNPDTLKKLNDAHKAKKDLEQQECFDPKIADEERDKGNEYFKEQKYPEAIKHYTEAIKRNPKDARAYSNRAASYTKLGAMPEGLKDAEKCIELDPTFTKGYGRRGHADGDDDFQKIKEPSFTWLEAHRREEINMDIQRPYTALELVESREDLISQNLHQLNLGEISRQKKLDGLSEDNNMVKQEAGSASSRNQTTSSRKHTGFGSNRLLFGITKKGRSKYTSPKEELMVLDETGNKSESVQTVDKWTEGASSSLNPRDNSSSCMSENITGTSPEKERFEDELKEAHSLLRMDDDLVSFMDRKPFWLHILDLSGTSISNLPKCISELVTLESLTLRDCILLMELPPEIGELTNLKLLDLLGTEVVCLPKEIAKLVSLRSFRIALCGYADHFKESRGIDSVIPRNALSKLSNLSDFRIHVNPDGDWWDVEVKAVIEDLRDLGNLRTLHLDLPKVDLLDDLMRSINQLLHLSSLCFRLTVGPHEERIIHRLPQHVENEFHDLERFEKGVKYTNSEGIPVEIKNTLNHADAFLLERHWSVKNLLEFGVENMNELKCCILLECNELQTVVDADNRKDFNGSILGSLECLSIHYMKKMERIWKGPVMKGSLSNMKSLALHTCVSLTTVFTLDLLANLMNLEELIIEDCPKIKTLVSSNSPNFIRQNFLPKLKTMLLLELPNLGCISSGLTIAPKLERLVIFYCPKLDKLSPVEISSRVLKVIKGEKRWWDALNWYESGATEEEQEYLAGKFVPLRKDEDLEEQFMRD